MTLKMRHGSLESGIGMFDYAAEQMQWDNVFHCEINPFCRTVLNHYWPKAKSYADVFEFDGNEWRGKVDIITAGFPCQPFSHAGKRKGSQDDRHIWPENMRIFREAQPPFIVCENVPGLLTIESGVVFEQVCADLENEGYEVGTYIIPAVSTDKDHRRDRIWIVAYSESARRKSKAELDSRQEHSQKREGIREGIESNITDGHVAHSKSKRCYQTWEYSGRPTKWFTRADTSSSSHSASQQSESGLQREFSEQKQGEPGGSIEQGASADAIDSGLQGRERSGSSGQRPGTSRSIAKRFKDESWLEAATRLCSVDDGYSGRLDPDAISKLYGKRTRNYKSKWREESLKAYGNTIIWEIAFEIFKAIEQFNKANDEQLIQ